jgi:hypothetical protein
MEGSGLPSLLKRHRIAAAAFNGAEERGMYPSAV